VPVVPEAAASVWHLVTYNVHRCLGPDGQLSPRRIAEIIASLGPDIVALSGTGRTPRAHQRRRSNRCQFHPQRVGPKAGDELI
jgi:endonuclease/exonuclease/phosphatase family metal-dependent hydrolase